MVVKVSTKFFFQVYLGQTEGNTETPM